MREAEGKIIKLTLMEEHSRRGNNLGMKRRDIYKIDLMFLRFLSNSKKKDVTSLRISTCINTKATGKTPISHQLFPQIEMYIRALTTEIGKRNITYIYM